MNIVGATNTKISNVQPRMVSEIYVSQSTQVQAEVAATGKVSVRGNEWENCIVWCHNQIGRLFLHRRENNRHRDFENQRC